MPTFDEVLQEAGEFGRYQKRVFFLLCMTGITFAYSFVAIVFLGEIPKSYWCRSSEVAELSRSCRWSPEEEWNLTVPKLHFDKSEQTACHTYDITWNINSSSLNCENPIYAATNLSLEKLPIKPCEDGWVYEEYRTTIISQYNLVCKDAWKLDMTQASLNFGFLIGALTLGYAADRYGRKVTYLISAFGVGLCGIVVAFAPNFYVMVIFRFLQGIFGKGTWMTCYVIITELVGSKQRRIVGIVVQMFFTLGVMSIPGIAYLIPSWRGIQLAITLPNFLFLLYYWFIPESPRWLLIRKEKDKALRIMGDIAKHNGRYLTPNYCQVPQLNNLAASVYINLSYVVFTASTLSCFLLLTSQSLAYSQFIFFTLRFRLLLPWTEPLSCRCYVTSSCITLDLKHAWKVEPDKNRIKVFDAPPVTHWHKATAHSAQCSIRLQLREFTAFQMCQERSMGTLVICVSTEKMQKSLSPCQSLSFILNNLEKQFHIT